MISLKLISVHARARTNTKTDVEAARIQFVLARIQNWTMIFSNNVLLKLIKNLMIAMETVAQTSTVLMVVMLI